jgi:hypothetical protein
VSASDRERPLVTGVNGPANHDLSVPMAASWSSPSSSIATIPQAMARRVMLAGLVPSGIIGTSLLYQGCSRSWYVSSSASTTAPRGRPVSAAIRLVIRWVDVGGNLNPTRRG